MKTTWYTELSWLIRQSKALLWLQVSSLCLVVLSSVLTLLDPLIIKWLLDEVLPKRSLKLISIASGAFLAVYISRLAINNAAGILAFKVLQRLTFKIRLDLFQQLQRASAQYHDSIPVGETLYCLEQDISQIGQIGGDLVPQCFRLIITAIMIMTAMVLINWPLAFIVLPIIPIFIYIGHRYRSRLREYAEAAQTLSANVSAFLQEQLIAMPQVQLLTREDAEAECFIGLSEQSIRGQEKWLASAYSFSFVSMSTIACGISLILGYGGYQVVSGKLTIGGLIAFYGYLICLFEPLSNAINITSRMHRAGASIRRVLTLIKDHHIIADKPRVADFPRSQSVKLELINVSFQYCSDRPVLTDVNLKVGCGERVALVGASGSGKSTICKLIPRLHEIQSGEILLNDLSISSIPLKSLRSIIGMVPQDPVLFDATLRDNLLYGNPHASQYQLDEIARVARLNSLIERMPHGWNEPIGPLGKKLSGGERQRVALARAMLREPDILVLDEPTSALDGDNENALLALLDEFSQGRTVLVVSHRLSTILWADRIIVIDQGRIVEQGSHKYLCQQESVYKKLYKKDFMIENAAMK